MQVKASLKAKREVRLINFKVSAEEERVIRENAEKYFKGNVSGWIRYTAMSYVPSKKELVNS